MNWRLVDRTHVLHWWRLLPIPRSSPVYMALRLTHENFEEAHQAWRSRYMSGGKSLAERPKRIGRGVHQLRACAALVIEWLWICHRHGWLGVRSVTIRTAPGSSPWAGLGVSAQQPREAVPKERRRGRPEGRNHLLRTQ